MDEATELRIADEALALLGTGRHCATFSARHAGFDLPAAYRIAARLRARREARGERAVGRKIGFTNRTIWDEYGVHAPIWGWVFDSTLREAGPDPVSLAGLSEPRIEPEIAFGLARAPAPGMGPAELLGCCAWVAHGFEVVQSVFPGWAFAPADTVAAYGLHGLLILGPRRAPDGDPARWLAALSGFRVTLARDGAAVDGGEAAHVLGGPLEALRHLVGTLAASGPPLAAGEVVTTGTLTRAFPVAAGQTWSTALHGIDLPGLAVRFH